MSAQPSLRRWRGLLAAAVIVVMAGCARAPNGGDLPFLPIGGDFQLLDHDGQPFALTSLKGQAVLIFFGYSSCPDACPTTLSKLAAATRRLGAEAGRVKTLYISVDPDRDTPSVLKADLANFALDALGLTGTRAQIDAVVRQYGAAYEIVPTPGSVATYSVHHSTFVYGLDREGRTRIKLPYEATIDDVVHGIEALLAAS